MSCFSPNDVIPVGFRRGKDVELLCTDNGLQYLPAPVKKSARSGDCYTVIVAQTPENLVALRLCGVNVAEVM